MKGKRLNNNNKTLFTLKGQLVISRSLVLTRFTYFELIRSGHSRGSLAQILSNPVALDLLFESKRLISGIEDVSVANMNILNRFAETRVGSAAE